VPLTLMALAGTASLPSPNAEALTAIELTLEQLVAASTLIVEAQPAESLSVWESTDGSRGRRIVTYTRLALLEVLDGQVPAQPVWVRTLGGRVGDIGQHIEGEATFTLGQASVVFLRQRRDATHTVVGMGQGHYPVALTAAGPTLRAARVDAIVTPQSHAPGGPAASEDLLAGKTVPEARALIATIRARHAR
jgi:hypothetical protein